MMFLLRSEDRERRASAAQHLTQLLGRGVKFNAAGEPQEREAHLKVIRETLIRR